MMAANPTCVRRGPGRWAWLGWSLPWLVLAAALWWWAWPMQLERACWVREWPFEEGCPDVPDAGVPGQPSADYVAHLQRNVGDSRALAWLASAYWSEGDARATDVLPWALQLAPNQSGVLLLDAQARLQAGDWGAAARALITLLERGQTQAGPDLLALMRSPRTAPAVLAQLSGDALWLDPLLATLDRKAPVAPLLPFVTAGQEKGLLKPATVLALIDRLQQEGGWLDAYGLWVAGRGPVAPGLYNGGFDHASLRRGFDWAWTPQPAARQGFRVDQVSAAPRPGSMLELTLTGRGALPTPLVSQAMILTGERYRLRGQVMVDRLLAKEGLVWALRCAGGGERWAQSAPVLDTQRRWVPIELEFEPPADCGAAVRLQLETTAAWEARAGMVGTVDFDDFTLESLPGDTEPAPRNKPRGATP